MKVKIGFLTVIVAVLAMIVACTQPFKAGNSSGSGSDGDATVEYGFEALPEGSYVGEPRTQMALFDFAMVQSVDISIVVEAFRNDVETGKLESIAVADDDYYTSYTILNSQSSVVAAGVIEPVGATRFAVTLPTAESSIVVKVQRPGFTGALIEIENPARFASIETTLHIGEPTQSGYAPMSTTPLDSSYTSPPDGVYTIAYEDLFPQLGDADYNDFIASFHFEFTNDARGVLRKIEGWVTARARGAGYDHKFGFIVPMTGLKGTLTVENYDPADPSTAIPVMTAVPVQDSANVVVFENTKQAFRRETDQVTFDNAYPEEPRSEGFTAYFQIADLQPIGSAPNPWFPATAPFDPYLVVHNTNGVDVHLIGKPPLDGTTNPAHTLDWGFRYLGDTNERDYGFPWALLVPVDWQYPLERTRIDDAYPRFVDWVESFGETDKDWYLYPDEDFVFPNTP